MANRPIPVKAANEMIAEYQAFITTAGIQYETQYIRFTSPELLKWLDGVRDSMDELRICLGVYPPGHESAGLMTTILWPYKDGKPAKKVKSTELNGDDGDGDGDGGGNPGDDDIDPYNDGQTGP